MSKQYNTCPYCGAHLDPGERCDCQSAAPGGHQYGNQTGAKVYPNRPSLPEIVFSRSKQQKEKTE